MDLEIVTVPTIVTSLFPGTYNITITSARNISKLMELTIVMVPYASQLDHLRSKICILLWIVWCTCSINLMVSILWSTWDNGTVGERQFKAIAQSIAQKSVCASFWVGARSFANSRHIGMVSVIKEPVIWATFLSFFTPDPLEAGAAPKYM